MPISLWYILLGLVTGALFLALVRAFGPSREQSLLALGLTGAAALYVCFALWGKAQPLWLGFELGGLALYSVLAWGRAYGMPRLMAIGWLLHPLWDVGMHWTGTGAEYAPHWYVVACPSFDLLVGAYLLYAVTTQRGTARQTGPV